MMKVFVAMPVSDNLASDGSFRPERRSFFEGFVQRLASRGFEVASAGSNEMWGSLKLTPPEFTRYDIDSIADADLVVVVTNERLNRDMYLEAGLAVARGIPVIFVIAASTKLTYMAQGLQELGLIRVFRYDADADALGLLDQALDELGILAAGTALPVALDA